jgi:hypothetical protein
MIERIQEELERRKILHQQAQISEHVAEHGQPKYRDGKWYVHWKCVICEADGDIEVFINRKPD